MQTNLININPDLTMSSLEIVKVINAIRESEGANTELMHSDFLKKVPFVLGEIVAGNFSCYYVASNGKQNPCYNFPKREAMLMLMSYSYTAQAAVYDAYVKLENQQPKLPTTYKEALLALIAKEEALEQAIATKAEIGDRRQATAMNTASQLSKQLDKAKDFATIKRIESITGAKYNWRELKKASVANDYPVNDVFDANYGTVKSYHADAWLDVYGVDITEFK